MTIYVAGPYTKGDVAVNVRTAIEAAEEIAKLGHDPFVPHFTHFWHMLFPHEYKFWLKYDVVWLEKCDALLRLPGESKGADEEVEYASKLNMRVFLGLGELENWVDEGLRPPLDDYRISHLEDDV